MMWQQMLRFGMVGVLATFVHMIIGYLLIQSNWHPISANIIAFGTAFMVSFIGHLAFSFADQETNASSALWKFTIVALIGLALNEALLIGLLSLGALSGILALCTSTSSAAVMTFILSKTWAFRAPKTLNTPTLSSAEKPI